MPQPRILVAAITQDNDDVFAHIQLLGARVNHKMDVRVHEAATQLNFNLDYAFIVVGAQAALDKVIRYYHQHHLEVPALVHLVEPQHIYAINYAEAYAGLDIQAVKQANLERRDATLVYSHFEEIVEKHHRALRSAQEMAQEFHAV